MNETEIAPQRLTAQPPAMLPLVTFTSLLLSLGAGILTFTQTLAHRLGYHPALGQPVGQAPFQIVAYVLVVLLLVIMVDILRRREVFHLAGLAFPFLAPAGALVLGPLYAPQRILPWLGSILRSNEYRHFAVEALAFGLTAAMLAGAFALVLHRLAVSRADPASIAHGSARLANSRDLQAAGLFAKKGVVLGAWRRRPLVDAGHQHVLLLMPPGAGKTSGPIVSSLLTSTAPALVLDPKGEIYARTAGWRASQGHRCLVFSPTADRSWAWNPLDEIERGPEDVGQVLTQVSNLLVEPPGQSTGVHWLESARSALRCLVLHSLYSGQASYGTVRALLNAGKSHAELFRFLASYAHDPELEHGWRDGNTDAPTPTHPEVHQLGHRLSTVEPRELSGIISTLQRFLDIWGHPRIAANTSRSDFKTADLLNTSQPTTIYLAVPHQKLETIAPLVRLLLACLIQSVTATGPGKRDFEDAGVSGRRIEVYLDEFRALGPVPIVQEMQAFLRGYGMRLVLAVQGLAQLQQAYGAREPISGLCDVWAASATQDPATQKLLSEKVGEATVRWTSRSRSGGLTSGSRTSVSTAHARRPLLTAGEVAQLPASKLLVFKSGMPPALADRLAYFENPILRARSAAPLPEDLLPDATVPEPPLPTATIPEVPEAEERDRAKELEPGHGLDRGDL